jgi:PAS domain S-box-containing protein
MRGSSHRSLRVQLAATFAAVALLPVAIVGALAIYLTLAQVRRDASSRNQQIAFAISGEVGRYLEAQLLALRLVSLALEAGRFETRPDLEGHVEIQRRANPAMKSVLVLDRAGKILHASPSDPDAIGMDLSGQPFVREARDRGEPTWSSATMSMQSGTPVVALTIPGRRFTVVGYLDLEALEAIAERTRAGTTGEAAVIDRDGTVIAHRDRRLVRQQVNVRDVGVVRDALEGREGTAEYVLDGRAQLGSASRVSPTHWVVLVSEPLEQAFEQADRLRLLLVGVLGAAVLAAIAVGLASARRILGPIDALAGRARRIAEGEYASPPAPPPGPGFEELDALSASFDTMAAAVAEREEALARSEQNYRSLVSAPVVGIVRTHLDGTILFSNEAFARLTGNSAPEDVLGQSILRYYRYPEERARILAQLRAAGQAANAEVSFVTATGKEIVVLVNAARRGDLITSVLVDITELRRAAEDRERLEQQLLHAQKLEAVGRLAGSVAHDFNNLLTAILSHAALLEGSLPKDDPGREDLEGIQASAQRAAHLTRSLLAYGRKQTLRKKALDLREVVRAVEPLVQRLMSEDVHVIVALPDEPLGVVADAPQIEQVLVNLCTNARDAMPRGGRLVVEARRVTIAHEEARAHGLARGGPFVRMDVRDSGEGIEPDLLGRIFEPFFTTKDVARGTGLGLSIVEGIVRQHGGYVGVESSPGIGTTFSVLLPEATSLVEPDQAEQAPAAVPRGRETILLAEDEPHVRRALRATLERAGYAVLEAVDGEDAVRQFAEHREDVALCLLDVRMPRMNGRQAYEAIAAMKPGTRTLFASGYTGDILESRPGGGPLPDVIVKPVSPPDLLRRVRETLDRAAGPSGPSPGPEATVRP